MNVLQKMRPLLAFVQALALAVVRMAAASRAAGQAGTSETVIQKATEQFEDSPLKITSLGRDLYVFSGDGGNVTTIVDDGSTLLVDSGVASRTVELNDAVFKMTMRPVTRLINTHWHFDHTGGNVYFGSGGVTIIAQQNAKTALVGAGRSLHWSARWPLSGAGTTNSNLFKHDGVASRFSAADIGQLRGCAYGWRHDHLHRAGERRGVGDIFSNAFYPIIDLTSGGSIDGMILSVDRILAQTDERTKVVPGHGPVATRADLQAYRGMPVQVRQRIQKLIAAGKTMDKVVAAGPTKDFDAKMG